MKTQPALNLSQIPKELKLIIEIISGIEDEKLSEDKFQEIDWSLFIELAMHHRIFSLLYIKLIQSKESLVPPKVLRILENAYKSNTLEMLRLSAEMEYVNKLCMEHQIPLLFLKGPILASELYGDLSLRTSCDLDFLIPISDLKKMEQILIDSGYQKDDYILSVLEDWKWRHHHITFFHPDKKIKLEVHWRLNPGPGIEPSFHELWSRRRRTALIEQPIYYLGKEDLFFFLISHGSRHGWSRLRWLIDIHQLLKQYTSWPHLYSHLKKYQGVHIAGQALILCSNLLETKITEEIKLVIQGNRPKQLAQEAVFYLKQMVSLHSTPLPLDISEYHKHHLFALMSFKQKILFIVSFVHPYYTDVETLPLPRRFHFMYFPLRPILWVWRKAKNLAMQ